LRTVLKGVSYVTSNLKIDNALPKCSLGRT
jgi:hypothetical protein